MCKFDSAQGIFRKPSTPERMTTPQVVCPMQIQDLHNISAIVYSLTKIMKLQSDITGAITGLFQGWARAPHLHSNSLIKDSSMIHGSQEAVSQRWQSWAGSSYSGSWLKIECQVKLLHQLGSTSRSFRWEHFKFAWESTAQEFLEACRECKSSKCNNHQEESIYDLAHINYNHYSKCLGVRNPEL